MPEDPRNILIEWMCSYCGDRKIKPKTGGRPTPGKCPRKKNGGPHTWRMNRRIN